MTSKLVVGSTYSTTIIHKYLFFYIKRMININLNKFKSFLYNINLILLISSEVAQQNQALNSTKSPQRQEHLQLCHHSFHLEASSNFPSIDTYAKDPSTTKVP